MGDGHMIDEKNYSPPKDTIIGVILYIYIKCSLKNKVALKITIRRVIDQIVIFKATSFFYRHLMDT
jgi:hypothetical protein